MKTRLLTATAAILLAASNAAAIEPADRELIPEARRVLDYLASVYGQKTLSGMASHGGWRPVYEVSGRAPAIYGNDAFGWNKPKWGDNYKRVLQGAIDSTRRWWEDKGGIPQMQYHWGKPGDPNGSAWVTPPKGTGPVDIAKTVTPGTPEHRAAMDDLRQTADYLKQLAKARVPVLWRPLHEIDGGWFWWTDKEQPENTAALWRMIFDYFTKERKLHNLIWVFNPGVHAGGYKQWLKKEKREPKLEDEIAFRKRYYPGAAFVDLAGIDIYPNQAEGYGAPMQDTYPKAFEIMKAVAPGKILALCETAALVNPDQLKKSGPPWLYCMPWFAFGPNPAEWMRTSFTHDQYLTADELPLLGTHNIAPDVRLLAPADGAAVAAGSIELRAFAQDRNGNLKSVEFFVLGGSWKNWFLRDDADLEKELASAVRIGEAKAGAAGEFSLAWPSASAGCHNIVAMAKDSEGKRTFSNFARVSVGLANLARHAKASASSDEAKAAGAVDGDLFSAWNGKRPDSGTKGKAAKGKGQPTASGADDVPAEQWLALDLSAERTIGGVIISWGKAYARAYQIQISGDGRTWSDVFRQKKKSGYHGDADMIAFQPAKARHVRLLCQNPGTDWGGYTVYELGVYESLPTPQALTK